MKRSLPGLLIIVGFLTSLISCNPPKPNRYALLTDMALSSLQNKPNLDSADRAQMEALSSKPSAENDFGSAAKDAVFCCCPCPALTGILVTSKAARDTTHCPCPSFMEMGIMGPDKGVEYVEVDGTKMEASDPPAGDSLQNAKIYQLPKTTTLSDGTHKLVIKGDLTGLGVTEYELVFETVEGKPYIKNMKE